MFSEDSIAAFRSFGKDAAGAKSLPLYIKSPHPFPDAGAALSFLCFLPEQLVQGLAQRPADGD
ncbi:MAG: hypothetical protein ACI4AL_02075, partial [Aristaeellaceae bacterium]